MNSINLNNRKKESGNMYTKKQVKLESPDTRNLQAVRIDSKTTIFIALGANPEKAKSRFLSRFDKK